MLKTIRIQDFSGGYNTAVEESMLPTNMSADLVNVDLLDSKGIRRRNGYACVTGTPMPAAVSALYRFYRADGARYWLAVSGSHVYSQQYAGSSVPLTRKELTSANLLYGDGSSPSFTYDFYPHSGGSAVWSNTSGTLTATLPYCTQFTLKAYTVAASYKVDSGAWTSISATLTTLNVAPGTHTLKVKPGARNNKSLAMTTTGTLRASKTVSAKVAQIAFYDDGSTTAAAYASVATSLTPISTVSAGITEAGATVYRAVVGGVTLGNTVARTVGWHTLSFWNVGSGNAISVYLDDSVNGNHFLGWYTQSGPTTGGITSMLLTAKSSVGEGIRYFDSLYLDNVLTDDFADATGWTVTGTGSAAASTTRCDTAIAFKVDYVDYSASTAFTVETGAISGTATDFAFATLDNKAYFGTAYNNIRSFDGSVSGTVSASGSNASAFMVELKRRLFVAGKATDAALLEYTDLDQPQDWNGGGAVRVTGKDSGGECTGLSVWSNRILYFTPSRIHSLETAGDPTAWTNKAINYLVGTSSPKTIAQAPNGVVFLASDRSVKMYGLSSELGDQEGFITLSENIAPTLATITDANIRKACGAVYKGRYWLTCAITGTTNDTTFVYRFPDEEKGLPGAWTRYDYGFACLTVTRGDEYGLYAGGYDGAVYKLDTGDTDNGEPIAMHYATPPLAPGGYEGVKHFRVLFVAADSPAAQALTVTPSADDVSGSPMTITFDAGTAVQPVRVPMHSRGRSVAYTLDTDGAGQPLTVNSIAVQYLTR